MTETDPPEPGWWKAADGNWYPPESQPNLDGPLPPVAHPAPPAELPLSNKPVTADATPPPLPNVAATPSRARVARKRVAAVTSRIASWDKWPRLVALLLGTSLVGSIAYAVTPDPVPSRNGFIVRSSDGFLGPEPAETTERDPLAYGAVVPIEFPVGANRSKWNVQVSPPRDITAAVLAENPNNEPPPEGVRFVGFDVEMTLASADEALWSPGFGFAWELLGGATSTVYDKTTIVRTSGCGDSPDAFDQATQVLVSGTVAGTVCIPLPIEDLDSSDTVVAINFRSERVVFADDGATPEPADVGDPDPGPYGTVLANGVPVPVTLAPFGDIGESTWNVTISPPRDVLPEILDTDRFNGPPPEGITFLGFDLEMTLAEADEEPLWPGTNFSWEILGGETLTVYTDTFGCGLARGDFSATPEVFVGGTLSGLVCIPIPTEDLGHPNTQVMMSFDDERLVFADDGTADPPADIEPGAGVAGVGEGFPLDAAVELDRNTLGDGDGSRWSTTVTNWRDMTDEVLAENQFNEPPPDDVIFVGFDIEMTLLESPVEPLATSSNLRYEILGAATNRIYRSSSIVSVFGCGVTPNEFDISTEVFVEGTLSGTVCIPVPASDFADPATRISLNFRGNRVTFAPSE